MTFDLAAAPPIPGPAIDQAKQRLRAEEISGIAFSFKARLVALAAIMAWLLVSVIRPEMLLVYFVAVLIGAGNGWIVYLARGTNWVASAHFLGLVLDMVLICVVQLYPGDHEAGDWALHLWLRRGLLLYFMFYIALNALSYSPLVVLCAGAVATVGQFACFAWVVTIVDGGMETLRRALEPHALTPVSFFSNQVVMLWITCCLMAAAVWRARRHVTRSVEAERDRANLARYFSPNLVDRLAVADRTFETGRQQMATVLFVDIVGFTRLVEGLPPATAVALLRAFHKRMAAAVFHHNGTLDKFIGDGLMATFGTPEPLPGDAARALACAVEMVDVVDAWNRERRRRFYPEVEIAVGLQLGMVMMGTIGSPDRLEFTVMGDTVNIASRLERLTREHAAVIMAGDELVQAARRAGVAQSVLGRFERMGEVRVPGRQAPIGVWIVRRTPSVSALSQTPRADAKVAPAASSH